MKILTIDSSTHSTKIKRSYLHKFDNLHVVYLIVFPNNKMYCGYSSNIYNRWSKGINAYHSCRLVYKAFKKYDWNNPNIKKYIVFTTFNQQKALEKEKEIIKKLGLLNPKNGYNLSEGGNLPPSWKGKHHTQQTKKKLSQINKIKWQNSEYANFIKKRMKEAAQSRPPKSVEERKRIWGAHNLGRTPHNAKPIFQIDLQTNEIINEYPSAGQAAVTLNLEKSCSNNVCRTANGTGKSAYGYGWRWKHENISN